MAESAVVLNPGADGAVVRTETVTTTAGAVQEQVVAVADAQTGNTQAVNASGEAAVFYPEMLAELRMIRIGISLLCADHGIQVDLEGAIT